MRRAAPLGFCLLAACAGLPSSTSLQVAQTPAAPVVESGATLLADEASAALARRDAVAAVQLAELAVESNPSRPAARVTLARSYVAAGRFDAAVKAWGDVLAVAPENDTARLNRALALIAASRTGEALAVLANLQPDQDVGLAYALAGDPRGLAILQAVATGEGATARARQNLALAHALAGDWQQARAVAVADIPAAAIPRRLVEWQRIVAAAPAQRVAILLGAQPATVDFGRPEELAPPPVAKPMTVAFQPRAARGGGWVVQVGAYASEKEREEAWTALMGAGVARGYQPLMDSRANWRRLSLSGFAAKLDAQRMCVKLKAAGKDCFVRLDAPSA